MPEHPNESPVALGKLSAGLHVDQNALSSRPIKRRHVFHIAGYDPISPESQLKRFTRSLSIFSQVWGVACSMQDPGKPADVVSAAWTCETQGPDWTVHTTYEMLRWDDLIRQDFTRTTPSRLLEAMITLADFLVSGTLARYFRTSWKYACFFLFPYLCLALFAFVGAAAGYAVGSLLGFTGAFIVGAIAAVAVFAGLLHWLGSRWLVTHMLDDWIFSRRFLYGKRPDMEARLAAFSDRIVACAKIAEVDEIIIVGHCLGAGLAIDVVARALTRDPALTAHGPTLGILTAGATIPKFALHPAGGRFREASRRIADNGAIPWAEYQARDDAISFYRVDPVTLTRLPFSVLDRFGRRPIIRRVHLHDMMQPNTFKRNRFNFMRLHYQFIMANDRRSAYDHFMFICGPLPFAEAIALAEGPLALIGQSGTISYAITSPAEPAVAPAVRL